MTGFRVKASDERTLAELRAVDPEAGPEGVLMGQEAFNRWLERAEKRGINLEYWLDARPMGEDEYYGLNEHSGEMLEDIGVIAPGRRVIF
jgi:sugar/nucleoside kinase (ribokinase family)